MPDKKNRYSGSADYLFQRIAAKKPTTLSLDGKNKLDARQWFRDRASEIETINPARFMGKSKDNRKVQMLSNKEVGQMFMFSYDAKLKKRLPYWDRFPLIFMIETYSDGFLGINLHYLPPGARATLMDALYRNLNNKSNDDTSKLLISYKILKSAAKYKYFKPCVKRYIFTQVRSSFTRIQPNEWDMTIMLPLQRFEKAKAERVWAESMESI